VRAPDSPSSLSKRTHGMADIPIIEQEGLKLATDSLCYFAHWITPEASPIRFDARFFVASAPPDQEACSDGLETTVAKWISPQELLEEHRKEVVSACAHAIQRVNPGPVLQS